MIYRHNILFIIETTVQCHVHVILYIHKYHLQPADLALKVINVYKQYNYISYSVITQIVIAALSMRAVMKIHDDFVS